MLKNFIAAREDQPGAAWLARFQAGRWKQARQLLEFGIHTMREHGVGARWREARHINEIWYQTFHQMPFAPALVGASRESCRAYIGYQLKHWSYAKDAFDAVPERWVDNFMRPGNLQGGFNWYISQNAARLAAMRGEARPDFMSSRRR